MMPKHCFFTVSKYIHLSNPNNEDASDLLSKGRPLVSLQKHLFREKSLVKSNERLSAIFQTAYANEAK